MDFTFNKPRLKCYNSKYLSIIATPGEAASQILKDLQQQLQHQHNVNIRSRQQSQESQATPRAYIRNQNMVILCQSLFPVYYLLQ